MEIQKTPLKEKACEWFKNYCLEIEEQIRLKEEIINDSMYVDNLVTLLNHNTEIVFRNDDSLEQQSIPRLKWLRTLYDLIRTYANNNYIVSTVDNDGISYYISYNDIIIKVGFVMNESSVFFAKKINVVPSGTVVMPFSKVRETLLETNKKDEKQELTELYNFIKRLKEIGITDSDIVYTTAKALKYVN